MAIIFTELDKREFFDTGKAAGFTESQLKFMWDYCYALDRATEDFQ